jgi:phosphoribosylformylglycinamidine cyclo-ligase
MDYKEAGVDVEAGRAFVEKIRTGVESTYRPEVLGNLGGFGGCFELPKGYQQPVLVSGTDGVGTKLKIAQVMNCHTTIGIDLVAMCVNDILTCGAEPLFFLDYLATGKLNPQQLAEVIEGVVEGCKISGCALLGGETAEMPGFYSPGEYDVAGFCVGVAEKSKLIDGSEIEIGDRIIALVSSGVHSNGFSLVRKIIEIEGLNWNYTPDLLQGKSLGEVLLTPTQIYVKPVLGAIASGLKIRGIAHITGGGFPENMPRCLQKDQALEIKNNSWPILPIFQWIEKIGKIKRTEMFNTFNMGIGLIVIIPPQEVETALNWFNSQQIAAYEIGKIIPGNKEVKFCN